MSDPRRDSEADVARDDAQALSRAVGGVPQADAADTSSTTGTTPNEEFVGRVAGQDAGFSGETGAEARAAAGDTSGTSAAQQGGGR